MFMADKTNSDKPIFEVGLNTKYKDVTCTRCKKTWQEYYTGNTILIKECNYCHAKYKVIPETLTAGKEIYVAIAYDNLLIAIGEDKEAVQKLAEKAEKEDVFISTIIQKYKVKDVNGCSYFEFVRD